MMVDNEMEHIPIAGDQSERAREHVPIQTISLLQRWFHFKPDAQLGLIERRIKFQLFRCKERKNSLAPMNIQMKRSSDTERRD